MNSEEIEIIGRDELRRLKQELQDLKEYGGEVIGEYEKQIEKLKAEIKLLDDNNNYLNNIIDELEKWLEDKIHNFNKDDPRDTIFHEFIVLKLTYDYLQELKEVNK